MIGRKTLFSGVAPWALHSALFAGGLLLANAAAVAPANAAACTTAEDSDHETKCVGGATGEQLTYVGSNGDYDGGLFTLRLDNHDVTDGGIELKDLFSLADGFIILENGSDVTDAGGAGIFALGDDDEDLTITVRDTSTISGGVSGIEITNIVDGGSGDVTVSTEAGTTVAGLTGDGINARGAGGGAIVTVTGNVTGGDDGIDAIATGDVRVTADANVTGGAAGIVTKTDHAIVVTTGENSEVTGGANGIIAESQAGTVTITANGKVTGNNGDGIIAVTKTDGAINVVTGANSDVSGVNDGIEATSVSGSITIETGAKSRVNNISTGAGIFAETAGAVKITTGADSTISGTIAAIDANSTGGGVVTVETGVNSQVGGLHGIEATSASGPVTVTTGAGSAVTGNSVNFGDGILATSTAGGAVTITTGVDSVVIGINEAIQASATGAGIITIANNGETVGATAIEAVSETGAIKITNSSTGEIRNRSDDIADLAIHTTGGATTIDNNTGGIIRGRIHTGVSDDTVNNAGVWATSGFSIFGAGRDVLNNSSVIFAANTGGEIETTNLVGLETLNNSGFIFLSDQLTRDGSNFSDELVIDGDYAGSGGAVLGVDASLGGAGSKSDVLAIIGNSSGVTKIAVNNTSLGPGGLNTAGILVVRVEGTGHAGDFVLANGPIDAGFFVYDLIFNDGEFSDQFLLASGADAELFEPLAMVASSQEIWFETAGAWEARQQAMRGKLAGGAIVTAVADPPLSGSIEPENGLWFSALGSWTARNSEISGFNLSYDQSVYGFVAGADFGVDIGSDGTLLFGVLAGYIDSTLKFDANSTSIKTDGATLGIYASLLQDGFFVNVLIQADLLKLNFSAPALLSDTSDAADVVSIGARADIGYRFDAGSLFIEPMLSLDAVSTSIDELSLGGADIDPGSNESFRAGAGLRAGLAGERATASLTGRVWNVFATDNEVVFTAEDTVLDLSDDGLEGLYGEVSGQVDIDLSETIVLFAKGGVLFSDDITKPSVSGGLNFSW